MKIIGDRNDIQFVMLPRSSRAGSTDLRKWKNVIIPTKAVDGMNLLYHSDLVISGGGTMNREAAALGIPTVTIFKGPMGAVDQWLIDSGKMIAINNAEEIVLMLRKRETIPTIHTGRTKDIIVETILRLCTLD
jgi:predicted glycosyltransferase